MEDGPWPCEASQPCPRPQPSWPEASEPRPACPRSQPPSARAGRPRGAARPARASARTRPPGQPWARRRARAPGDAARSERGAPSSVRCGRERARSANSVAQGGGHSPNPTSRRSRHLHSLCEAWSGALYRCVRKWRSESVKRRQRIASAWAAVEDWQHCSRPCREGTEL